MKVTGEFSADAGLNVLVAVSFGKSRRRIGWKSRSSEWDRYLTTKLWSDVNNDTWPRHTKACNYDDRGKGRAIPLARTIRETLFRRRSEISSKFATVAVISVVQMRIMLDPSRRKKDDWPNTKTATSSTWKLNSDQTHWCCSSSVSPTSLSSLSRSLARRKAQNKLFGRSGSLVGLDSEANTDFATRLRRCMSRPGLDRPPAAIHARTKEKRSRDLPDRQWSHCCNGALTPWALVRQGSNTTKHYNPLLLYSVNSSLTLRWTLIVNLIYWFAQSVPTFSGSTTQPSSIPRVLYLAKPRPYLELYPYRAVHNTLTILN